MDAGLERYACELCRRRYRGSGMCPEHPDEPLLDLTEPEVRLLFDKNEGHSLYGRAGLVGLLIGAALYVMLVALFVHMGFDHEFAELFVEASGVLAALGFGVYISKIVVDSPPPFLDEAEVEALEAARRREEDLALAPTKELSLRPR